MRLRRIKNLGAIVGVEGCISSGVYTFMDLNLSDGVSPGSGGFDERRVPHWRQAGAKIQSQARIFENGTFFFLHAGMYTLYRSLYCIVLYSIRWRWIDMI